MFTEDVLKICIAQIAKYVGFRFINSSSFEILIDLLIKYILEFGKLSVSFANQCNRTPKEINFNDICFVFKSMGLNLNDLSDYLLNVNLPFAGPLLPKLPIDNKKTFRIQLPNKIECDLRKDFYQDWQPSLNNFHKNLNNLKLEDKQLIDNRLEELDLVDYFEQKRNLKIIENPNLNRQILNRITNKINKFNISGFTDLTAQTPNYIYLSDKGEVLSFGNKPGKLAEPRQHNKLIIKSDYSKKNSVVDCLKESKKSKRRRLRKEKKKKLSSSYNNLSTIVENSSSSFTQLELLKQQIINKQIDKLNRIKEINKIKRLKPIEDQGKSCERIVSELVDEMISSVEDNLNGKLDESFYDENEAARTLVLLSYDNKNTSTTNSINELSPKLNDEETNIDYSLTTKYNYDLNNNYTMNDLNNNQINQKKENGFSNNLINNQNNNLRYDKYDKYHLKKNNLIDQQSNDLIHKLTIRDEQFDEPINLSTNSNRLLNNNNNNNNNNFNNSNTSINSNSSCKNGTKLKIKLSFDEFKRNSDVALINNTITASPTTNSNNLNTFNKSESKFIIDDKPINKSINNISIDNSTDHFIINNHPESTTKDKQKRKRKSKKSNNSIQSIDNDDDNSRKSINSTSTYLNNHDNSKSSKKQKKKSKENGYLEDVYICPTCSKPEDGNPWIACDKCSNWYHWQCQNIFIAPKEEEWYCLSCKVNEELEAQKLQKKKLIKLKEKDDKHNKKRSKDVQKQEDKRINKNLNNKKNHQAKDIESKWICPTCSNGDDGSEMIGCDRCDFWYHYRCVNLTKAPPKNEDWYCKNCLVKKRKLKK